MAGIGLGDVVTIINGCIEVYQKLEEAGDQIEDVNFRLNRVLGWVRPVEKHLKETYPTGRYPQAGEVKIIVDNMKLNAQKIKIIFERYYEAQRKSNFWGPFQMLHFALGSSGKDLEKLITSVDRLATDLDRQVQLNDIINKKQAQSQTVTQQPFHGAAKQRKVQIMFVDPGNIGRSVVAHAYAQLVGEWTRRTNKPWFITNIHSAGLYIRRNNRLKEHQDALKFPALQAGLTPAKTAQDSLFDNKLFNYDYKANIREEMASHPSCSPRNNMFRRFDYIFVFTFENSVELQKLRQLVKKDPELGERLVPKEKGRIVMLGEYRDKNSSEILGPKIVDGVATRDDWNKCTSKIKLAFKGWLKEEMGWVQPERGALQELKN